MAVLHLVAGPGRQVADAKYYLNQLRQKNVELQREIDELNQQTESFHKDTNTSQVLAKRHASLEKEIRTLQGQLTDHNIILDKVLLESHLCTACPSLCCPVRSTSLRGRWTVVC